MTPFKPLETGFAVAPQISTADVAAAAAAGYRHIVNNRPEAEEPGQPTGDAIRAAAEAAGLGYTAIPVRPGGFAPDQVEALAGLIEAGGGPFLAFCRSGTRSAMLWALARAARGAEPQALMAGAAAQGYDLGPLRLLLVELASTRGGKTG
jgi:uncharacterized protein (TIGR01244 family)